MLPSGRTDSSMAGPAEAAHYPDATDCRSGPYSWLGIDLTKRHAVHGRRSFRPRPDPAEVTDDRHGHLNFRSLFPSQMFDQRLRSNAGFPEAADGAQIDLHAAGAHRLPVARVVLDALDARPGGDRPSEGDRESQADYQVCDKGRIPSQRHAHGKTQEEHRDQARTPQQRQEAEERETQSESEKEGAAPRTTSCKTSDFRRILMPDN